jgi:hypothetical protein
MYEVDVYHGEYSVVLKSDGFMIRLQNTVIPTPENIYQVVGDTIQPDINEGAATLTNKWDVDFDEYTKEVEGCTVEIVAHNVEAFITGYCDTLPYTPFYLVSNDNIYKVMGDLDSSGITDELLDISLESLEEYYIVKNINSGAAKPITKETIRTEVESGMLQPALRFNL